MTLLQNIYSLQFSESFIAFLFAIIICGIEPATYSAKTTQTYSITALSDNFSSYVGRYYTEDGLYYSFLYQTDKGITAKSIEADQSYIKNTDDAPYKIRFKNPVLNFLLGPWYLYSRRFIYSRELCNRP